MITSPRSSGHAGAPVPTLVRGWVTWTPLVITIVAGLASMIVPARLQQQAAAVRKEIVKVVEPARRAAERTEAAFTAEAGTTRVYALQGDTALRRQSRLARAATDSSLDSLARRAARVGGETPGHVAAMRGAIGRWRRGLDSLAAGDAGADAVVLGLATQQRYLNEVIAHDDSISEALTREAEIRRDRVERLSEQSMIANAALAMLAITAVIAVAWLTKRQVQLTHNLRRRAEEEIALREVARALSGASSVAELAARIAEGAVRATHASGAYVERRIDGSTGTMEVIAQHGTGTPPVGTSVDFPGSLTRQIIEAGEPVVLMQVGSIGESMAPYLAEHCPRCTGVVVPLITEESVLGALVVLRDRGEPPFSDDELWSARTLGDICTAALRRAVLTDAIEMERAAKALMLESAGDGICGLDPDGRFTFLNRAGAEMLGYAPEEVVGKNAHALVHHTRSDGTPYPEHLCPISLSGKSGTGVHITDDVFWRKDGTSFVTEYTSYPMRRGRHEGMVITFRDVTARRAAERERERLLEAERRAHIEADRRARQESALRKTAEALASAYTRADVSRQIAEWALVATEARGAFVSEVTGLADTVRVAAVAGVGVPVVGESVPLAETYTEHVLRTGEPVIVEDIADAEHPLVASITEQCSGCSLLIVPLHVGAEPVGALWLISRTEEGFGADQLGQARIFADFAALAYQKINLLEAVEQRRSQLEQVMGSRSRLMRGFSHDVKNPLGAADGHAALLLDGIHGALDGRQRESVERIRRLIRQALGLIDDLHELARAETGKIDVQRTMVDMRELIAGLVDEYRPAAAASMLTLSIEICTPRTDLCTDGRRVRQVLGNLLSNAIKYTDRGEVKIRIDRTATGPDGRPGAWMPIAVADSGPGIPHDKLDLLFREFSRINPAEKPGAGLGLAISQRMAEALGGRITVKSTVGHGSTFTLWVPDDQEPRAHEG